MSARSFFKRIKEFYDQTKIKDEFMMARFKYLRRKNIKEFTF